MAKKVKVNEDLGAEEAKVEAPVVEVQYESPKETGKFYVLAQVEGYVVVNPRGQIVVLPTDQAKAEEYVRMWQK